MEAPNSATEWLQLSERYRQMSDSELLILARQNSELTDIAQQMLASEMTRRALKLPPEGAPAPPIPEPYIESSDDDSADEGSAYDEDRKLVDLCTVWSLPDAQQLEVLLNTAGIPFFMGPEKATMADAVTSSFANGVSVQIMQVGVPWARQALADYMPANEPRASDEEELSELPVRCPKCHSEEVIFDRLITEGPDVALGEATDKSSPKFEWTCDACGHQWEDEGIVEEE